MATLKDVATMCGVSISTVSRVLNGKENHNISPSTRDKIWRAVRELGYQPNIGARNLARGKSEGAARSGNIGYILGATPQKFSDPFFSRILEGIEEEVTRQGYLIGFSHTAFDFEDKVLFNKRVNSELVDGVIMVGTAGFELFEDVKARIEHIVAVDTDRAGAMTDSVIVDYLEASRRIMDYLVGLGHRHIGFIAGSGGNNEPRFIGYRRELERHGLPFEPAWVVGGRWDKDVAYESVKRLLQTHPPITAFYAGSDTLAVGAMRAMVELGFQIPQDFSIVGFDDIEIAAYTVPPLTTVRVPKEEMGRIAVRLLIERIQGIRSLPVKVVVPTELVIRESCGVPVECAEQSKM